MRFVSRTTLIRSFKTCLVSSLKSADGISCSGIPEILFTLGTCSSENNLLLEFSRHTCKGSFISTTEISFKFSLLNGKSFSTFLPTNSNTDGLSNKLSFLTSFKLPCNSSLRLDSSFSSFLFTNCEVLLKSDSSFSSTLSANCKDLLTLDSTLSSILSAACKLSLHTTGLGVGCTKHAKFTKKWLRYFGKSTNG
ncbi:hypothetical protein Anas_08523 [Armadillidium nasatum]|uniref:Uncharacterized protein n=1 Tax=Armadillidium nasatum TaxID=96803 RepID=A0A5N5TJX3_9CRUS|nr:hypothetical protein Anas_08523 [Armadillidium nasatum]